MGTKRKIMLELELHEIEGSETSLREIDKPGRQNTSEIWTNLDPTLKVRKSSVMLFNAVAKCV